MLLPGGEGGERRRGKRKGEREVERKGERELAGLSWGGGLGDTCEQ